MWSQHRTLFPSLSVLWHHRNACVAGGRQVEESHEDNYPNARRRRRRSCSFSLTEEYLRAIQTKNTCTSSWVEVQDFTLLLEPQQETLAPLIRNADHRLPSPLPDFFDATLGACNFCGSLVDAIRRARAVQLQLDDCLAAPGRLAAKLRRSSSGLRNPFSGSTQVQFERVHEAFDPLARQLISAHHQAMRRGRRRRGLAARAASLFTCGGAAMAMEDPFAGDEGQLGAAARGAFALDRDFDTMRSMVRRLRDEMEHTKDVIKLFIGGGGGGDDDDDDDDGEGELMLREVVKEMQTRGCGFMDKLEELEEQVFLCFLNINRARRMVLQEIVAHQDP